MNSITEENIAKSVIKAINSVSDVLINLPEICRHYLILDISKSIFHIPESNIYKSRWECSQNLVSEIPCDAEITIHGKIFTLEKVIQELIDECIKLHSR